MCIISWMKDTPISATSYLPNIVRQENKNRPEPRWTSRLRHMKWIRFQLQNTIDYMDSDRIYQQSSISVCKLLLPLWEWLQPNFHSNHNFERDSFRLTPPPIPSAIAFHSVRCNMIFNSAEGWFFYVVVSYVRVIQRNVLDTLKRFTSTHISTQIFTNNFQIVYSSFSFKFRLCFHFQSYRFYQYSVLTMFSICA